MKAIFVAVFVSFAVASVTIAARMMKKLDFRVVQICNATWGLIFVGSLLLAETIKQDRHPFVYEKAGTYLWVIIGGIFNSGGQNAMIYSMQFSNPNVVALYRFCGVIWGFIWDISIFKREFDFLHIAGLSVVLCANVSSMLYKHQMEKMEALPGPKLMYEPLE